MLSREKFWKATSHYRGTVMWDGSNHSVAVKKGDVLNLAPEIAALVNRDVGAELLVRTEAPKAAKSEGKTESQEDAPKETTTKRGRSKKSKTRQVVKDEG